mmetsp:Transcript_62888/g.149892  ORF Transcript_62888/g.149892 Transcript_62888/m.149892 type:complete len:224 (+) Transcript_62888:1591-2262(+)
MTPRWTCCARTTWSRRSSSRHPTAPSATASPLSSARMVSAWRTFGVPGQSRGRPAAPTATSSPLLSCPAHRWGLARTWCVSGSAQSKRALRSSLRARPRSTRCWARRCTHQTTSSAGRRSCTTTASPTRWCRTTWRACPPSSRGSRSSRLSRAASSPSCGYRATRRSSWTRSTARSSTRGAGPTPRRSTTPASCSRARRTRLASGAGGSSTRAPSARPSRAGA